MFDIVLRCRDTALRHEFRAEYPPRSVYVSLHGRHPNPRHRPRRWLEALAESEAELAAGRIVPGEVVRQMFGESIARLEAKQDAASSRKAASRR